MNTLIRSRKYKNFVNNNGYYVTNEISFSFYLEDFFYIYSKFKSCHQN